MGLGVMANKEYSKLPHFPEREPYHQMQFIEDTFFWYAGLFLCKGYSRRILSSADLVTSKIAFTRSEIAEIKPVSFLLNPVTGY